MNPMFNIQQLLKSGKNPRDLMINYLSNNNNPIAQNVLEMANNNDIEGIEKFARNYLKEQGRDFDTEVKQIQDLLNSFK